MQFMRRSTINNTSTTIDDDVDSGHSADAPTVSLCTESGQNDSRSSTASSLKSHEYDAASDLSYSKSERNSWCTPDVTLIDDDMCDAKNEAEFMFFQVVEMLRCEQEVCLIHLLFN